MFCGKYWIITKENLAYDKSFIKTGGALFVTCFEDTIMICIVPVVIPNFFMNGICIEFSEGSLLGIIYFLKIFFMRTTLGPIFAYGI